MPNALEITLLALASLGAGCLERDHIEHIAHAEAPRDATPGARARTPHTLKLATWNLEWLHRDDHSGPVKRGDADYARLRRYVERLDADVIAFQEVDGIEAAARVFDPAHYQLHVTAGDDRQRAGFAVRRGLHMEVHPDYDALVVGQLRAGADITVHGAELSLRLLSVHLKSGCFEAKLDGAQRDCQKLAAQLPMLERWIDARGREGEPAVVLGDFNRRLFARKADPFWAALDDADPPASDLWSPTEGQTSTCWAGELPDFIDHLVLNLPAKRAAIEDSFELLNFEQRDVAYRRVLSDHCPIALTFEDGASGAVVKSRPSAPVVLPPVEKGPPAERARTPIKGNLSRGRKKLYHLPSCPDYARVEIDESKGERWFATPEAAEAAGFTRAGNCPR